MLVNTLFKYIIYAYLNRHLTHRHQLLFESLDLRQVHLTKEV